MKRPKLPWTPWHEVVRLREDLRSGELPLHMFAADLYEVLMQSGKQPVYEDPEKFFALTFPTYNLRQLVRDVVLRVAGLCFDKLDVEKGMQVRLPRGKVRLLKQPWSVLVYQLAGDEILPENLPDAWSDGTATALPIATALSQKFGQTMPWKTVKDVITASINARFAELDQTSGNWPCDYPAAQSIKLKIASGPPGRPDVRGIGPATPPTCLVAHAELEPSEIQDLAEIIPNLLELKAKFTIPLTFRVQIELGDGKERPPEEAAKEINKLLKELKDGFELQ